MANVKISFLGTEESLSNDHELQCYLNSRDEIFISIDTGDEYYSAWICIDKSTAIKLAKTLRTEINKMGNGGE